MNPRVLGRMANQHGLITRQQALAAGMTERELRAIVARKEWVVVRRGVYADAGYWAGLDHWVEQPKLRSLAASLTISLDHVLSHDSAADWLGLPILRPDPDLVHVTRDHVHGSRNRFGVKHHGAVFHPDQVVEIEGVKVLCLARTAADIAREHGVQHGTVACDGAMRLGISRSELRLAYEPMDCWPGHASIVTSVDLADPGSESVGETLSRLLVLELGIGEPETQFEIRDENGWARCDLRVGRHIFEFDGRKKYLSKDQGGLAEPGTDPVWAEKTRQDFVTGHRLGMSRVVWADLFGLRRQKAKQRLLREYLETERRWGSSIEDLRGIIVVRRAG